MVKRLLYFGLVGVLLSGCGLMQAVAPAPTPTPTATPAPKPTPTPDPSVWFSFATSLSIQLGRATLLGSVPEAVVNAITLLISALQSVNTVDICNRIEDAQATVLEWCLESNDPDCQDLQDTLEEIETTICP